MRIKQDELKPCPFCGKQPYVTRLTKLYTYINCFDCDVSMSAEAENEGELKNKWNNRIEAINKSKLLVQLDVDFPRNTDPCFKQGYYEAVSTLKELIE